MTKQDPLKPTETEEHVDLQTVTEYLIKKEPHELSYAELERYQKGTTFSRAQVQRLWRRWRVFAEGADTATADQIKRLLPHSIRGSFVLDRLLHRACMKGRDGKADFSSFVELMSHFEQACDPGAQSGMLFHLYDIDDDGKISEQDLFTALTRLADNPPPEAIHQVVHQTFQELDTDRDGFLKRSDFDSLSSTATELLILPFPTVP
ncbi:Calcineurin subunit B [Diplonema papillatum]|nr:Calcineurin subunit B [Diplonema papillatum]